ncbi:MAG: type II toxin-antitoxin system PemK/MazF family toxin [bacterium]|nr:type II toxin-antitoxin system PemK/MazF family toxin [bacterium]
MLIKKYDIVLVLLDPTRGSEQKGTRPCLVVQNNEVNKFSRTTVVCPFTTTLKDYFFHVKVLPSRENGLIQPSALDLLQIRTVDKERIVRTVGVLEFSYREIFRNAFLESFDVDDHFAGDAS